MTKLYVIVHAIDDCMEPMYDKMFYRLSEARKFWCGDPKCCQIVGVRLFKLKRRQPKRREGRKKCVKKIIIWPTVNTAPRKRA